MFENNSFTQLVIGRSTIRQGILALLITEPGTRLHLREIQRRAGTSPGTASRELGKLVAAGLVDREAEGNQVYFRASDSPIVSIVRQLFLAQGDPAVPGQPARMPQRHRQASTVDSTPEAAQRLNLESTRASMREIGQTSSQPKPNEPASATPLAGEPETGEAFEPKAGDASNQAAEQVGEQAAHGASSQALGPKPEVQHTSPSPATPDPLALVVAARFCAAVRPLYGERLKAVFLYGARAAGPGPEDADIEILVVLDSVERYGEEIERTSAVCAQLSFELGLVVSRVFVPESEWSAPRSGFVAVVPAEEVAA